MRYKLKNVNDKTKGEKESAHNRPINEASNKIISRILAHIRPRENVRAI